MLYPDTSRAPNMQLSADKRSNVDVLSPVVPSVTSLGSPPICLILFCEALTVLGDPVACRQAIMATMLPKQV